MVRGASENLWRGTGKAINANLQTKRSFSQTRRNPAGAARRRRRIFLRSSRLSQFGLPAHRERGASYLLSAGACNAFSYDNDDEPIPAGHLRGDALYDYIISPEGMSHFTRNNALFPSRENVPVVDDIKALEGKRLHFIEVEDQSRRYKEISEIYEAFVER